MRELLRQLVAQTSLAIALYEAPGQSPCAGDDHRDIVSAVAAGDGEESQRLMRDHLVRCEAQLTLTSPNQAEDLRSVFAAVLERRRTAHAN